MSEGPPPFHPHLSADGAWRWDGRAWVPVGTTEASAGVWPPPVHVAGEPPNAPVRPPEDVPPVAHADPPAEGGHPPEEKQGSTQRPERGEPASRYGWPMVGALIGASLVVLAAIIGAALLAYRAAGSPPPNAVATPSARPVDPNSLDYRYLAGVRVPSLTAALEEDGFSCAAPAPPEDHLRNWRCDRTRGTQHDIVQIWAVDETHVHLIDVTTVAQTGPLDQQGVVAVRTAAVPLVFPSSGPEAAAASTWVGANAAGNATTSVGGVTLRTDGTDVATLLAFDAGTRR